MRPRCWIWISISAWTRLQTKIRTPGIIFLSKSGLMSRSQATLTQRPNTGPPQPLPGFEGINRYWDPTREVFAAKILPGEYYVTTGDEIITTVLGSCVSACIRDKVFGVGGMNHFMLPVQVTDAKNTWEDTDAGSATRYGNYAMEHLINDILKRGGIRKNLETKLFGGGKVLAAMTDVGHRNISFVREYLMAEGLKVMAEDLGGRLPRKVVYFPRTGKAMVKALTKTRNDTIVTRETKYLDKLHSEPVAGEIDLF